MGDPRLEREVAIKVLPATFSLSEIEPRGDILIADGLAGIAPTRAAAK